jgi:hypothetical protein
MVRITECISYWIDWVNFKCIDDYDTWEWANELKLHILIPMDKECVSMYSELTPTQIYDITLNPKK